MGGHGEARPCFFSFVLSACAQKRKLVVNRESDMRERYSAHDAVSEAVFSGAMITPKE